MVVLASGRVDCFLNTVRLCSVAPTWASRDRVDVSTISVASRAWQFSPFARPRCHANENVLKRVGKGTDAKCFSLIGHLARIFMISCLYGSISGGGGRKWHEGSPQPPIFPSCCLDTSTLKAMKLMSYSSFTQPMLENLRTNRQLIFHNHICSSASSPDVSSSHTQSCIHISHS